MKELNTTSSILNSGPPRLHPVTPSHSGAGVPHPLPPSLLVPLFPRWQGPRAPLFSILVGGRRALCLAAIVPDTRSRLTDTRADKRERAEKGEGPPLAFILGGGGGEKTRRAGHLWCVSIICSDWLGLHKHTSRFPKEPLAFVSPRFSKGKMPVDVAFDGVLLDSEVGCGNRKRSW